MPIKFAIVNYMTFDRRLLDSNIEMRSLLDDIDLIINILGDLPLKLLFETKISDISILLNQEVGFDRLGQLGIIQDNDLISFARFHKSLDKARHDEARNVLVEYCGDLTLRNLFQLPRNILREEYASAIQQAIEAGVLPILSNDRCCDEDGDQPQCKASTGKYCSLTYTGLCSAASSIC